jgi:exopolysaccharide biosynthesis predicted pyruvyltransferase EpsI
MNTNLIDFLLSLNNEKIKYVANPGNAGDSLIAAGTLALFRKLNLDFKICNIRNTFYGDTIIYGGGGNLIKHYDNLRNFLWENHENNKIIVLPHTVYDCIDLLNSIGKNTYIFAREEVSYEYIKDNMNNPENAFLSNDMAFHFDDLDFYKQQNHTGECNAFRLDLEKTNIQTPKGNKDISNDFMFKQNTFNEDHINISTNNMFSYLCKFETINTNRLHVAIAGSLLGRKVNLYPNSYFKNKAVFDFSIKNKFINTSFIQ